MIAYLCVSALNLLLFTTLVKLTVEIIAVIHQKKIIFWLKARQ